MMIEETAILLISALALYSLSRAAFAPIHKRLLLSLFVVFAIRSAAAILAVSLGNHHQHIASVLVTEFGVRFLSGVAGGLFLAFWITGGWTTLRRSLRRSPAPHDQT
ncbi:hypothetical protein DB345_02850 [Spartobacteria bacterium LR76]|nr:hypothetical protein DB345_02850 [Spartobacteria bacterium LR76]